MFPPKYDVGIVKSCLYYLTYGLHPGSCTYNIIIGDLNAAYHHAHMIIKGTKESSILLNTYSIIHKILPDVCKGPHNYNSWIKHNGLVGAPIEHIIECKMVLQDDILRDIIEDIYENYNNESYEPSFDRLNSFAIHNIVNYYMKT